MILWWKQARLGRTDIKALKFSSLFGYDLPPLFRTDLISWVHLVWYNFQACKFAEEQPFSKYNRLEASESIKLLLELQNLKITDERSKTII